jgi:hypothetical protein
MRSLEESVQRLETLAGKLNKATDKLNEQIEAFERRLSVTRIGLEIWLGDDPIPADPLDEDRSLGHYIVGWSKIGDWRLATYKRTPPEGYNGDWDVSEAQPLVNAPRHVRMRALPLVLSIVERLGNEAERWLSDVEKALNGTPELGPPPADDEIPVRRHEKLTPRRHEKLTPA